MYIYVCVHIHIPSVVDSPYFASVYVSMRHQYEASQAYTYTHPHTHIHHCCECLSLTPAKYFAYVYKKETKQPNVQSATHTHTYTPTFTHIRNPPRTKRPKSRGFARRGRNTRKKASALLRRDAHAN